MALLPSTEPAADGDDAPNEKPTERNGIDPVVAIQEDSPLLDTPPADRVAGFQGEAEIKQWARNDAKRNAKLTAWDALGTSKVQELAYEKERLVTQRERLNTQIANEPDTIRKGVYKTERNVLGLITLSPKNWIAILGVFAALTVACGMLGVEFVLEKAAALESDWGFAQVESGAFGFVFAASFGTFLALTFWNVVEKYSVHWSVRRIGRTGVVLSAVLVIATGFALGSKHIGDDQNVGWPMLIIPLGACVLIVAACGAKEFAILIAKTVFPRISVPNPMRDELKDTLTSVNGELRVIIVAETNALKLIDKVAAIVDEYVDRVHGLWVLIKKYEQTQEDARKSRRQSTLAEAHAKLAQQDLDDRDRPE